eukprot:c32667_g1_i1.p2 GENE.c32667_g1_i1~~c32667_g1_i1.p2  ORF type:complete len:203 (+),score=39.78 c32667_g1_i1:69-677(+)
MAATHFRGRWSPYLSTPQKAKPRVAETASPPKAKASPAAAPVKAAPVVVAPPARERLTGPPRGSAVLLNIKDRKNEFRSWIAPDGECFSNTGETIGFINVDDFDVGSADMEYLGKLEMDAGDGTCTIYDNLEEDIAALDMGRAIVKDKGGSTIAEIQGTGEIHGNGGTYLGQADGFGYAHQRVLALYLVLVDTGMLSEVEPQ